ncbi:TRAP transporter substrate-binding protein [Pseudomonas nicosulfuronedens]
MYKSLLGVALSALYLVVQPAFAEEPIVIKFSHVVADDTPKGRGALLFKKLVEERLAGQVKVEVFANSTLFGDADELQALKDGKVQMLAPSLSKFEGYTKQLEVFDLPFLFDDLEAVKRFQKRDKSRELLHSMARSGIYGLAYWNNGMKQLSANRELRVPADAKGLAFRIQPSSVINAQFGLLDATGVKLPFAETLKALQDGKVQGTENTWSNIGSQRLDSAQPFITETNHGVLSYMVISNQKFWNSMPYAVRTQLENIVEEVTVEVNKDAEALNQKERDHVVANGKTRIVALTPAERDAWRTAMQPLWKQFEGEIGSDVLRAAQVVNRKR